MSNTIFKICTGCKRNLPLAAFTKHKIGRFGKQYKCRQCRHEYYLFHKADFKRRNKIHYRKYAEKYKTELTTNNRKDPRKQRCRSYVRYAKKIKKLSPLACENCGGIKTVAHHPDYDKPEFIKWLCGPCHWKEHHIQDFGEKVLVAI